MIETANRAARAIRAAIPEKLSHETPDPFGNLFSVDNRLKGIEAAREFSRTDEDTGGALVDFIALVNPSWQLSYLGADAEVEKAKASTESFCARLFDHAGNLDGLINNQIGELYTTGGSSLEWYPSSDKRSVQDVEVIPYEEVRIKRSRGEYRYFQKPKASLMSRNLIELSPVTYKHVAMHPSGSSPYGTPVPLKALHVLKRKRIIDAGLARYIGLLEKGALATVTIPKPEPEELGIDPAELYGDPDEEAKYADKLEAYMADVIENVMAGREMGVYFAYETEGGKPDISITAFSGGVSGINELELNNLFRVWSSIGSAPFLRGYMNSTTESLAKTVWLMLGAHALNAQPLVCQQMEFGLNLNLRLGGVAARAVLTFGLPPNPYADKDAATDKAKAETHKIYLDILGEPYREKIAREQGVAYVEPVIPDDDDEDEDDGDGVVIPDRRAA